MYMAGCAPHLEGLSASLRAGNKKESHFRAHTIKGKFSGTDSVRVVKHKAERCIAGSSMQVGATLVAQRCVEIETAIAACNEGDVAALSAILPTCEKLNAAYKDYVATFRAYLATATATAN